MNIDDTPRPITVGPERMFRLSDVAAFVIYNAIEQTEVVRISNDGRVVLSPGVTVDEASLAFWQAMEDRMPGICQRVIDSRRKGR